MRAAIACVAALLIAGCVPLPTGKPQTLTLVSDVSVPVVVRVGTFRPGEASVSDDQLIGETPLNPKGTAQIDVPPGKYTLDAVAQSDEKETAVTSITVVAGTPKTVTLVEHFELYKKSQDPGEPTVNKRTIGWDN